jgi:indolepyruvate ferredoxin oxidoreductase beta subunit
VRGHRKEVAEDIMETNIILCGVGGQGILSISFVIDMAALKQGLNFKQSEVHGMSQRGGAVISHLRVSDRPVWSDLVPMGRGTIVLSVEPLEALRYLEFLAPEGVVVTSVDPHVNIPDYPDRGSLLETLGALPRASLLPSERLARGAGSARAANMVLLGAASPYLGLRRDLLEEGIREAFARKGERVQRVNLDAFQTGLSAEQAYRACREAGIGVQQTLLLVGRLAGGALQPEAVPLWQQVFSGPLAAPLSSALEGSSPGKLEGSPTLPRALLSQPPSSPEALERLIFGVPA